MDMDINYNSKALGEQQRRKLILLIMVGVPGSGKSTFCDQVIQLSHRPWVRVCQDTISHGKPGKKEHCMLSAASYLTDDRSVFIDRCNMNKEQRQDFIKLGGSVAEVHAVVLDLPAKLCISRSVLRTEHEGNLQGGNAVLVVNKMLQNKDWPKLSEGFTRITFCHNESDVQAAINLYSKLSPSDTLSGGIFGQKSSDGKTQLGIMKFFKKIGVPVPGKPPQTTGEKELRLQGPVLPSSNAGKDLPGDSVMFSFGNGTSLDDALTLAFPSMSTSDFQFNLDKASDIIVEKVKEFLNKIGNARLVLVDLSHKSKILSLVKEKASHKNIDSNKFFTFVGDITQLYSQGGLRCNVIANAANWRLKPGGGGVNAAIFSAAGSDLIVATKEQARSILPGNAVVVPLPATSPLFSREGITHVIHVLGPNMNPERPNCLNNDYTKGCQVLYQAYTSLFEGFASIVRTQLKLPKESNQNLGLKISRSEIQGVKRVCIDEPELSKKSKGSQAESRTNILDSQSGNTGSRNKKSKESSTKHWGSWAQSLYHIAMQPEKHKDGVLDILDNVVVLNDLYPKARKHILVLACHKGLDCLADASKEHLELLRTMHATGLKWAEKFLHEDASLVFRLGYHSNPSMRQLHLHVISQDFDSSHLKHKKHWNSFNTPFFCDSLDVIEEVDNHKKARLNDVESMLSMELRCHRCNSAHPNIPRLKAHISICGAPFPTSLLQRGHIFHSAASRGHLGVKDTNCFA